MGEATVSGLIQHSLAVVARDCAQCVHAPKITTASRVRRGLGLKPCGGCRRRSPGPWHIGCLVALSGEDPGLVNVSARWLVKIPKASIGLPMH